MVRPTTADAARSVLKQARFTPSEAEAFAGRRSERGFGTDSEYIRALVREDQPEGAPDAE